MTETIMEQDTFTGITPAVDFIGLNRARDADQAHETVGNITVEDPRIVCRNVDSYNFV